MADTPTADTPYIEGKNVVIEMDATKAELPRISRKFKLTFAAIVFILLNALALYLLHFLDRDSTSHSSSVLLSSASFGSNGANKKPVSFAPNGTLRVGAGTTAYLDAAALPSDTMQYINTVRMGTSQSTYTTNILTYYLPSKLQSVVTTVTANADKTLSMAEAPSDNVLSGKTIRGVATLSDTQAVFLEVSSTGSVSVVAGALTQSPPAVKYLPTKTAVLASSSFSNNIGAVSATTFVAVSFQPYTASGPYSVELTGGVVASDGSITTATPVAFGDGNDYSVTPSYFTTFSNPVAVPALSGHFALAWWSDIATNNKGLCIYLGTVAGSNGAVTKKSETCTKAYLPSTFLEVVSIAPNMLAMAFYDSLNGNTLTIATVQISTITQTVVFRGVYTLGAAASGSFDFGNFFSFSPKPSLKALSSTRLALAFLNPSNAGKPYTQVFQISDTYTLKPLTPLMRMSAADFTLAGAASVATPTAVTLDLVPTSAESFVFGYTGMLGPVNPKRLSLVETYGNVAGIGSGSNGVTVTGSVSVSGSLTTGQAYYATTRGDIVTVTQTDADYFYTAGDATIVTKSSKIGVAVSSSDLYVAPPMN